MNATDLVLGRGLRLAEVTWKTRDGRTVRQPAFTVTLSQARSRAFCFRGDRRAAYRRAVACRAEVENRRRLRQLHASRAAAVVNLELVPLVPEPGVRRVACTWAPRRDGGRTTAFYYAVTTRKARRTLVPIRPGHELEALSAARQLRAQVLEARAAAAAGKGAM